MASPPSAQAADAIPETKATTESRTEDNAPPEEVVGGKGKKFKVTVVDVIKALWFFVCVLGFAYQSFRLSEMFFSEELVSMTEKEMVNDIYPPAFTFCFLWSDIMKNSSKIPQPLRFFRHEAELSDVQNWAKIISKWNGSRPDAVNITNVQLRRNFFEGIKDFRRNVSGSAEKLANEMSYEFHELVSYITFVHPQTFEDDEYTTTEEITEFVKESVTTVTSDKHKCFKINLFARREKKFYDRFALSSTDWMAPFFRIHFGKRAMASVKSSFLYIHDNFSKPLGAEQKVILDRNNKYRIRYTTEILEHRRGLLSRHCCLNYANSYEGRYDTRAHALAECMESVEDMRNISKPIEFCRAKFPHLDCYALTYVPSMMDSDRARRLEVSLMLDMQQCRTVTKPKVDFHEFVAFESSVVGFWFGFSVVGILSLSQDFFCRNR